MKKLRKQILEDFNEAMFQFIQLNPPEGFKQAYFTILCMSGRLEEATTVLTDFKKTEDI